jgi:hypothetical protein
MSYSILLEKKYVTAYKNFTNPMQKISIRIQWDNIAETDKILNTENSGYVVYNGFIIPYTRKSFSGSSAYDIMYKVRK